LSHSAALFLFLFFDVGDWTQGLPHANHMLYHWDRAIPSAHVLMLLFSILKDFLFHGPIYKYFIPEFIY
jgi:hypothetical protein